MNNYQILGLKGTETKQEIKSKFRALSKQLHPDVNGGDEVKSKKFVEVLRAYEELMDGNSGETKQQQYKQEAYNQSQQQYKQYNYYNGATDPFYTPPGESTFFFKKIQKDGDSYRFIVNMRGVKRVSVEGADGFSVGEFHLSGEYSDYSLQLGMAEAIAAKFHFKLTLYDAHGYSATRIYKVKPPNKENVSYEDKTVKSDKEDKTVKSDKKITLLISITKIVINTLSIIFYILITWFIWTICDLIFN